MNRNNFVTIQGWMVTDLNLKGNDLLVYAIIYGFSQDQNQEFTGSLQYLADWTNSTKQGVLKNLKSLLDKRYIEKSETYVHGVKFSSYHATKLNDVLNKVECHETKFNTPLNKVEYTIKQSLTNNIDNNIEYNIDTKKGPDEPVFLSESSVSYKPKRNYVAKPIIDIEEEPKVKLTKQQKKQIKIKELLDIIPPKLYSQELINALGEYLDMRIDLHIGRIDRAWFEKEWDENIYPAIQKYSEEDIVKCLRTVVIPKCYKRCFININNYQPRQNNFNDGNKYTATEIEQFKLEGRLAIEHAKRNGTYRSEF